MALGIDDALEALGSVPTMADYLALSGNESGAGGAFSAIYKRRLLNSTATDAKAAADSKTIAEDQIVLLAPRDSKPPQNKSDIPSHVRVNTAEALLEQKGAHSPFLATFMYVDEAGHRIAKSADEGDLWSLLNQHKNDSTKPKVMFSVDEARSILAQIVLAIEALHSKNLAHRDIKTDNILIFKTKNQKRRIALSDFESIIRVNEEGKPVDKEGHPLPNIDCFVTHDLEPPEIASILQRLKPLKESDKERYNQELRRAVAQIDYKSADIYLLGRVIGEFYHHVVDNTDEAKPFRTQLMLLWNRLALPIIRQTPEGPEVEFRAIPDSRLKIEAVKQDAIFGNSPNERAAYFEACEQEFSEEALNVIDGYVLPARQNSDAFYFFPPILKSLISAITHFNKQLKALQSYQDGAALDPRHRFDYDIFFSLIEKTSKELKPLFAEALKAAAIAKAAIEIKKLRFEIAMPMIDAEGLRQHDLGIGNRAKHIESVQARAQASVEKAKAALSRLEAEFESKFGIGLLENALRDTRIASYEAAIVALQDACDAQFAQIPKDPSSLPIVTTIDTFLLQSELPGLTEVAYQNLCEKHSKLIKLSRSLNHYIKELQSWEKGAYEQNPENTAYFEELDRHAETTFRNLTSGAELALLVPEDAIFIKSLQDACISAFDELRSLRLQKKAASNGPDEFYDEISDETIEIEPCAETEIGTNCPPSSTWSECHQLPHSPGSPTSSIRTLSRNIATPTPVPPTPDSSPFRAIAQPPSSGLRTKLLKPTSSTAKVSASLLAAAKAPVEYSEEEKVGLPDTESTKLKPGIVAVDHTIGQNELETDASTATTLSTHDTAKTSIESAQTINAKFIAQIDQNADIVTRKEAYLEKLKAHFGQSGITAAEKKRFIAFLLGEPNHLLKEERGYHTRFYTHSDKTRSMYKAVAILSDDPDYKKTHSIKKADQTIQFTNSYRWFRR